MAPEEEDQSFPAKGHVRIANVGTFFKSCESALCDARQTLAPPLWDGLVTTKESTHCFLDTY